MGRLAGFRPDAGPFVHVFVGPNVHPSVQIAQLCVHAGGQRGEFLTFGALLLLPNEDRSLPAGLRCQVRFLVGEMTATASAARIGSEAL